MIHDHHLEHCPECGSAVLVHLAGAEQTHYQYELVDKPIVLHAHQSHRYWCASCNR
jgi:hypothetical protein